MRTFFTFKNFMADRSLSSTPGSRVLLRMRQIEEESSALVMDFYTTSQLDLLSFWLGAKLEISGLSSAT